MLYVKLAEHKQGDGKTDRLLGRESNWKGISFQAPKLSRGVFSLSHSQSSTYPHLTCTARSLNSAFF